VLARKLVKGLLEKEVGHPPLASFIEDQLGCILEKSPKKKTPHNKKKESKSLNNYK
jgi:hypothetical protein